MHAAVIVNSENVQMAETDALIKLTEASDMARSMLVSGAKLIAAAMRSPPPTSDIVGHALAFAAWNESFGALLPVEHRSKEVDRLFDNGPDWTPTVLSIRKPLKFGIPVSVWSEPKILRQGTYLIHVPLW